MQTTNLKIAWLRSISEERETNVKVGEGPWNLFLVEPKNLRKVSKPAQFAGKFETLEVQRLIDAAG